MGRWRQPPFGDHIRRLRQRPSAEVRFYFPNARGCWVLVTSSVTCQWPLNTGILILHFTESKTEAYKAESFPSVQLVGQWPSWVKFYFHQVQRQVLNHTTLSSERRTGEPSAMVHPHPPLPRPLQAEHLQPTQTLGFHGCRQASHKEQVAKVLHKE